MELLIFRRLTSKEEKQMRSFLSECKMININSAVKTESIRIRKSFGTKLPDSIIAATAIYMDLPLITADADFRKIDELQLIYYQI